MPSTGSTPKNARAREKPVPWLPSSTADSGRVPPRECIRAARDALNRAYGISAPDRHLWAFLAEALDWQRRALEQIAASVDPPDDGAA